MSAKVTVLGCGNSTGVPAIGNFWGACDPLEPKNRRTRSSIAVRSEKTTLIIDTGPDFHLQMNREDIKSLDAVLYTHAHADHIAGIDELRVLRFRQKKLIAVYANDWSLQDLRLRFDYLFKGGRHELYPPMLEPHEIKDFGTKMTIGDITFTPFEQNHGSCQSVGYRFGDFAYSTDMLNLDDAALTILKGIRIWIVDAAGYKDPANKLHANLETLYALNAKIGAGQVYLTSLSLTMDYQTLLAELPEGFAPAYDGLNFGINFT